METEIAHTFKYARERFNAIYKNELPEITPHPLDRTPAIVSLADDSPDDEGEPDMDWEPDEDD